MLKDGRFSFHFIIVCGASKLKDRKLIKILSTFCRSISNIIVRALRSDVAGTLYLIDTAHLEKTNSQTVARGLSDPFQVLWPNGIEYDHRVLFLITDTAR